MSSYDTVSVPKEAHLQLPYTGPADTPRAQPHRPHTPAPMRTDGRGLDLAIHYRDVRATVLSSCSLVCHDNDIDPEDLIGVVVESVLKANARASAYDPSRASVTRYLRTLSVSRLAHMLASTRRRRRVEQVGMLHRPGTVPDAPRSQWSVGHDAAICAQSEPGAVCPMPLVAIGRLLPGLTSAARAEDTAERALLPRRAISSALRSEQGWREQAVGWVALDSPGASEAAGWWKCSVREATSRLAWAQSRWVEAVEAMPISASTRFRPLPRVGESIAPERLSAMR